MRKNIPALIMVLLLAFLCGCTPGGTRQKDGKSPRASADNLILPSDTVFGGKVDAESGKLCTLEGFRASPVYYNISGEDYLFSVHNPTGGAVYGVEISGAYYDEQRGFISPIDIHSGVRVGGSWKAGKLCLSKPENCRYVRLSVGGGEALTWKLQGVSTAVQPQGDDGLVIVNLGDSIIGGFTVYDEMSISRQLSALTGSLVYNIGFGGGRIADDDTCWRICSLCEVADEIANHDFTVLDTAIDQGWEGMPAYFHDTMQVLSRELDFSQVDIITISYGTNDYYEALPLKNPADPTDRQTVSGALRYSVQRLQDAYPDAQIIVTTPIYRFFLNEYGDYEFMYDGDRQNWGGGTLNDYARCIKETCEELGIVCVDLKNDAPFNRDNRDEYFDPKDGAHPKAEGRAVMAQLIAAEILQCAPLS